MEDAFGFVKGMSQNSNGRRNVLFVCSRNQWRSPTAEEVFKNHSQINVRSGGTSRHARRTVNHGDIQWADAILVMETKHRNQLKAKFPQATMHRQFHVLGIPDEYKFMDVELVETLTTLVPFTLKLDESSGA